VVVRQLDSVPEYEDAVRVLCQVWQADNALDLVNSSVMAALAMSDNYVAGVFLGNEMVGAAVGWRGKKRHLHSHIAGIHPKHQGSGLGYELKMHERAWARKRRLSSIQWTYDPLVRRNAHFNLSKLGTRVLGYHENLYGSLQDGVNDGDHTDRLLVEWDVPRRGLRRLLAAVRGRRAGEARPAPEAYSSDLLGTACGDPRGWDLRDHPDATVSSADGSVRLIATPHDVETLRLEKPEVADQWREAVREGMRSALRAGFKVTAFTADGYYVLRRS
jgi:predicted GNAT superfamily acetyltransferase